MPLEVGEIMSFEEEYLKEKNSTKSNSFEEKFRAEKAVKDNLSVLSNVSSNPKTYDDIKSLNASASVLKQNIGKLSGVYGDFDINSISDYADKQIKSFSKILADADTESAKQAQAQVQSEVNTTNAIKAKRAEYDTKISEMETELSKFTVPTIIDRTIGSFDSRVKSSVDSYNDYKKQIETLKRERNNLGYTDTIKSEKDSEIIQTQAEFESMDKPHLIDRTIGSADKNIRDWVSSYDETNAKLKKLKEERSNMTTEEEKQAKYDIAFDNLSTIEKFGTWLKNNANAGAAQFNKSLTDTISMIAGGDDNNFLSGAIKWLRETGEGEAAEYANMSNKSMGGAWDWVGRNVVQGVISAVPTAIVAIASAAATGGASTAPTVINAVSKAPTLFNTVIAGFKTLAKNPMFWLTEAQTLGSSYNEAKADGADESEAIITSFLSSFPNAVIELSGGIETIPSSTRSIRTWVEGMLDEGKEEVLQGIVEKLTQKAIYDNDKKVFSVDDVDSVISLMRAGQEFAGGAVVGGILGGAEIASGSVIDKATGNTNQSVQNENVSPINTATVQPNADNVSNAETANIKPESPFVEPVSKPNNDDVYTKTIKALRGETQTEQQKSVSSIAKTLNRKVLFDIESDTVAGTIDKDGTIHINKDTSKFNQPVMTVFKHELTHDLESSKQYDIFANAVENSTTFKNWLVSKGAVGESTKEMIANYRNTVQDRYAKSGVNIGTNQVSKEVISEFVGDNLFTNQESINELAKTNRNIFDAIVNWIRDMKKRFIGSEQEKSFAKLEQMYKKAFDSANKNQSESVKNSIPEQMPNDTDSEGNKLSKGQAEYFKDSKVRDQNGNLIPTYHGTPNNFTVFSRTANSLNYGNGLFWFSNNQSVSEKYAKFNDGKRIIKAYLKLENPLIYDAKGVDNFSEFGRFANIIRQISQYSGRAVDINALINSNNISDFQYVDIIKSSYESKAVYDGIIINNASWDYEGQSSNTQYVAFKPEQIKLTNSLSPTENPDIRYSVPVTKEVSSLADKFKNGEISKEEFMQEIDENYNEAIKKYGTIKKGESPKVDVDVPNSIDGKTKVSRFTRTVMESGHLNDEMLQDVKAEIIKGAQSYKPISNEKAQSYAERAVKSGNGDNLWQKIVNGDSHVTKEGIAVGEALLKMEADAGHTARVTELIAELSEVGTRSGQAVQAMSMLKRMTGVGQLYYVQRAVNSLNTDLSKKYKSKAPIVKIRNSLAEQLVRARTSEDIDTAVGEIMQDVGEQVPATKLDKWNSWRYLAMLGNPRTHIRNLLGNSVFMPAVKAKNIIVTGLEKTFVKQENRTKSFSVKKEYKDFAKDDFKNVEDIITGNGKMNPSDQIRDNQKIFKNKVLEYFRTKNFELLGKEDTIFLKHHYEIALGGFLQAKGLDINNIEDFQLDNAREYAIEEAWKATFRDASAVAKWMQSLSYSDNKGLRALGVFVEGILPFKKTPINILKRGFEYSPVGLIKTLSKGVYDLNHNNITSSEFIDGLASGLTGVGITAIGMLLANLGVINGGFGDDDEDYFKKLNGEQEYSVQIGGKSYTIDWLAPASLPFFVGVESMNMINKNENKSPFSAVMDAMMASIEPMTELSMLSGISDTIKAAKYSDSPLTTIVSNSLSSYASQALPTLGGQISRTIDGTRRQTYVDKNSWVPEIIQTFVQSAMNKIPGASFAKQEYVDAQGQKDVTKNVILRAIENMISPGYASTVEYDKVNTELQNLYNKTGETSVLPKSAPRYLTVDGKKVNLTPEQYTEYATGKGDYAKKLMQQMIANEKYKKMEDAAKVTAIKNLYEYSNAKAKEKVSNYDATDNYSSYEKAEKSGNLAIYLINAAKKTQETKSENAEKKANN